MPKMPLSSENKAKNVNEFPKLFFDKGERARVVLLDPIPHTEYVHTMRAPQIVNGNAVYEKDDKGKEMMKFDFVGRHLCVGSFDVIADKGLDIKACPVCAESKKSDAVKPPERRHALNVIRYKTQPGGFNLQEPFQVEVLVWAFADKIHSQLIDFADEWGDLRKHDLLLGPCTKKQFQEFDINVAAKAEWMADDERKQLTAEVFKNNMVGDLTPALGRKLSMDQVKDDLSKVTERHAVAHGKSVGDAVSPAEVDVEDILNTEAPAATKSQKPVAGDNTPEDGPEPDKQEKVKETVPPSSDDLLDLDDILNM